MREVGVHYVSGCTLLWCVCVCRNARGQGVLRELLNPLVTTVVDDQSLQINTNPVELYKQWINQTEAETGQTRSAFSIHFGSHHLIVSTCSGLSLP